jgi:hypothetical protein
VLFVIAVASMTFAAWEPVSTVSLECSKIGEFRLDRAPDDANCESSVVYVFGVWPLLGFGALLGAPALFAATWMRRWISWTAVAAILCLAVVALANWSGWWGSLLLVAVPMTLVAVALALAQQFRDPSSRRRQPQHTGSVT